MRRALYLMGTLDEKDIDWLVQNGASESITINTALITEGKPITSLFIVLDGKLSVRTGPAGNEIAALYAGEIAGEISFVDSSPPAASVIAVQDSHLLTIPRTLLNEKLTRDAGFAARFYRAIAGFLALRLRATTSRLGFGDKQRDGQDPDELDDEWMNQITLARSRFDDLLKRLRVN